MKKIFVCIMAVVMGMAIFACVNGDKSTLKGYMPDGAPAIAFSKLMHDNVEIGGQKTSFTVVNPSTINTYLLNDSADFAIVPTNVAANVYNKGKEYVLAATATHGNLYIVGNEKIEDISEMKGSVIGVIGQSGTPDMIFTYILKQAEILHNIYQDAGSVSADKISIRYFAQGADAILQFKLGEIDYVLLGEPAVAGALANVSESSIVFDLTDLWRDATGEDSYPQACLVVKKTLSKDIVNELVSLMKEADGWAEEHPADALAAISDNMLDGTSTTIGNLSSEIIKRCNVKTVPAAESKQQVMTYLGSIFEMNSAAVGDKMPDDGFFYAA